jgi:hypothetical protein
MYQIHASQLINGALVAMILASCLGVTSPVQGAPRKGFQLASLPAPGEATAQADARIVRDIRDLSTLGANLFRFPVYYTHIDNTPYWIERVHAALTACEQRSCALVIVFFIPMDSTRRIPNREGFYTAWEAFATAFARRGDLRYDLVNEPEDENWPQIALVAAQRIRRIDSRHTIIYPSRGITTAHAPTIKPLPGISNQMIEFHFYDWSVQADDIQYYNPLAGETSNPPQYGGTTARRTKAELRARLERVAQCQQRTGTPCYIGEVAIPAYNPTAGRFLRDFTSLTDEFNIPCTIHAYREAAVWDYYARNPNAWNALREWLARK